MPKGPSAKSLSEPYSNQLPQALLNALDTNSRISRYLIDSLPPEAWNSKLPDVKGRTIAAIVAHMHNVRVMWLKAAKADDIRTSLIVRPLHLPKRGVRWKAAGKPCTNSAAVR